MPLIRPTKPPTLNEILIINDRVQNTQLRIHSPESFLVPFPLPSTDNLMRPAQALRDQEEFPLTRRKRPRFVAARTYSTSFVIIVQSLPSLEGQECERIWHAVGVLAYIQVRVFVVLDRWSEGGSRPAAFAVARCF